MCARAAEGTESTSRRRHRIYQGHRRLRIYQGRRRRRTWNGGAGKIQGITRKIGDNFDDTRVVEFLGVEEGTAGSAHFKRRIGEHRGDGGVDRVRLDQRLVALQVDHGTAGVGGHYLRDAVGAADMVGARHDRDAAKRAHGAGDAVVIGRDQHRVHEARRGRAAIHVLDHRPAGDVGENFSGETGRLEPRGDDGEDRRFSQRKWQTLDRIGVHVESYHSEMLELPRTNWS